MAENSQYYESRHKGIAIDNAIDDVGKHSAAIQNLTEHINRLSEVKADKESIPTSIVDLLKNPALTWVGENAPDEPYYNVWVYMPKNDAVKIYVRSSANEPWIDAGCDNILFIRYSLDIYIFLLLIIIFEDLSLGVSSFDKSFNFIFSIIK